jgi:hypothetical protein
MGNPLGDGKILSFVRSPLVFNAFVILAMVGVLTEVLLSSLPVSVKVASLICFFVWCIGITVWVFRTARTDPRSICYGPNEYLAESRLKYEHERKMAKLE